MPNKRYFVLLPFIIAAFFLSGQWNVAGKGIVAQGYTTYQKVAQNRSGSPDGAYTDTGKHKSKSSRELRSRAWDNDLDLDIPVIFTFSDRALFPEFRSLFLRYSSPVRNISCDAYQLRGPPPGLQYM